MNLVDYGSLALKLVLDGHQIQTKAIVAFLIIIGTHMKILFIINSKDDSHTYIPKTMLLNEPAMVIIFWAHYPISYEHMSSWYPF
jgi:hypothetical protein